MLGMIPLRWIVYAVMAIAIAAAVYATVHAVNHWHNAAWREVAAERDQLVAEKQAAQERATALALLWSKTVDEAERREHEREIESARRYDSLLARAEAVNRGSGLRLSVGTIRLLDDATH